MNHNDEVGGHIFFLKLNVEVLCGCCCDAYIMNCMESLDVQRLPINKSLAGDVLMMRRSA
jgi:hypothetical protein